MSNEIRSYRDLVAWQKAVKASLSIYRATLEFPADERFGLSQQLRRAAVSVPSNIAEGWGRGASRDNERFLRMARGSLCEVETQMVIAAELGYLDRHRFVELEEELEACGRVLGGLLRSVEARSTASR